MVFVDCCAHRQSLSLVACGPSHVHIISVLVDHNSLFGFSCLNDNKEKMLVWSNHDFLFARSHSEES